MVCFVLGALRPCGRLHVRPRSPELQPPVNAGYPREMTSMKRIWFSVSMAAALVAALAHTGHAQGADTLTLIGSGSGAFETPGLANAAVASGVCTLNRASQQIACTARVHNIVDLTQGHLHVGGPGASGPVILNIPDLPLRSSDDFTLSWVWTERDLVLRPAQGVLKMADVFEACSSGNCYLNFHTSGNPGGEVRAQMCPQGEDGRAANKFYGINVCSPGR
jgi:hypothetical protein